MIQSRSNEERGLVSRHVVRSIIIYPPATMCLPPLCLCEKRTTGCCRDLSSRRGLDRISSADFDVSIVSISRSRGGRTIRARSRLLDHSTSLASRESSPSRVAVAGRDSHLSPRANCTARGDGGETARRADTGARTGRYARGYPPRLDLAMAYRSARFCLITLITAS